MTDTLHGYNCPVRVGDRVRLRPNGVVWQVCEIDFDPHSELPQKYARYARLCGVTLRLRSRVATDWNHCLSFPEQIEQLEVIS